MATYTELFYDYGETIVFDGQFLNNAGTAPINLTGAVVNIQISSDSRVFLPSGTITGLITAATNGNYTILVPLATLTLLSGAYSYAVQAVLADGTTQDANFGPITIRRTAFGG